MKQAIYYQAWAREKDTINPFVTTLIVAKSIKDATDEFKKRNLEIDSKPYKSPYQRNQ